MFLNSVQIFSFFFAFGNFVICKERPVIGVLVQESKPWVSYSQKYKSYISASYVKAAEGAGARVVPVFIDKNVDYYEDLASKVNGFLYPGGAADVTSQTGYARSGKIVYDIVTAMNKKGDSVPILGVCLGMELIANIAAGGTDLRTPCSVKNEALSLDFHSGYKKSSLFSAASEETIRILSRTNATSNHHRQCILEETLKIYDQSQWEILSSSTSQKGERFISAMEQRKQPVAVIIFHPEKNAYEWGKNQANPHDPDSIKAVRLFYDWLVDRSRLNNHTFKTKEELSNLLIYNYSPIFTGKEGLYDYQVYYFND